MKNTKSGRIRQALPLGRLFSAREIIVEGCTYAEIRKTLLRLSHSGELSREEKGLYRVVKMHEAPAVSVSKIAQELLPEGKEFTGRSITQAVADELGGGPERYAKIVQNHLHQLRKAGVIEIVRREQKSRGMFVYRLTSPKAERNGSLGVDLEAIDAYLTRGYRKKPLSASCIQWEGNNLDEMMGWCAAAGLAVQQQGTHLILRGEEVFGLPLGHWVVRQENGEIRAYSPSRFAEIYEEVK